MGIESNVENLKQRTDELEVLVARLADVVDDMARERHKSDGHGRAYKEWTEGVCEKARRALNDATT